MKKTALILGASGKIGTHAIRAFTARGWICRKYDRAEGNMTEAAMGCDVIINGLNPPNYHNWAEIIPEITEQVIAAAKASGATVVLPGNVYVFGDEAGEWSEQTPHRPVSRKGKIRADMEARYAHSGVQVINLRAGSFIDPDKNADIVSLMILNKIKKGRIGATGDRRVKHAYAYLPDWARAVALLAEQREALGVYEDIPFPGHAFSLDELKAEIERMTQSKLIVRAFPWWLFRLTAPFWELARELLEMRYLFDTSHWLSSDRFDALLPEFEATPLETVLRQLDVNPNQLVTAGAARESAV
ncbi:epimerase [Lentibacter algarum]|nr:epimerase [Lentibacter algarum]